MKELLNRIGQTTEGSFVYADNAVKGEYYVCPECKGELILKKSGNTNKGSKRPHFAHKSLDTNCTAESILHYVFKTETHRLLGEYTRDKDKLVFKWGCRYCSDQHEGNMLKKVSSIELEYDLKTCRPDIALLTDGGILAVIEVVVTHSPEDYAIEYYKKNDIILIQYNLDLEFDLNHIKDKLVKPDLVDFCINPKCTACGFHQRQIKLAIIDEECWNCSANVKVAALIGEPNQGEYIVGPSDFSKAELGLAEMHGVIIKEKDIGQGRKEMFNFCPECNSIIGNHHLYVDYVAPHLFSEGHSMKLINLGYYCNKCYEEK